MIVVYIGIDKYSNKIKSLYKSLGAEIIHYKNPLKAMDNFCEINPSIIHYCKNDFPRVWKIVLSSLRETYKEDECIFVLDDELNEKESNEFVYLKGSFNLSPDKIDSYKEYLENTLIPVNKEKIFYPENGDICIGFMNPEDFSYISGKIYSLSESEIFIYTDESIDSLNLKKDIEIHNASLSFRDKVITISFTITALNEKLRCKIINKSEDYSILTSSLFV